MTRLVLPKQVSRPSGFAGVIAAIVALLFSGTILTTLLAVAIWPGEVKLVAPLFCSDAQPDAFVVSDTYSTQPGETTTNFTLYCMGPNGDATDKGFLLPFLATVVLNIGALIAIGVVMGVINRLRGRGRTRPTERLDPRLAAPGSTAGPFVD